MLPLTVLGRRLRLKERNWRRYEVTGSNLNWNKDGPCRGTGQDHCQYEKAERNTASKEYLNLQITLIKAISTIKAIIMFKTINMIKAINAIKTMIIFKTINTIIAINMFKAINMIKGINKIKAISMINNGNVLIATTYRSPKAGYHGHSYSSHGFSFASSSNLMICLWNVYCHLSLFSFPLFAETIKKNCYRQDSSPSYKRLGKKW